jgi:hypothetical protein
MKTSAAVPSIAATAPSDNEYEAASGVVRTGGVSAGPKMSSGDNTCASQLLQSGVPITYVSQQLGHKDPYVTLRHYAHWLPTVSPDRLVDGLDNVQPPATPRNRRRSRSIRIIG